MRLVATLLVLSLARAALADPVPEAPRLVEPTPEAPKLVEPTPAAPSSSPHVGWSMAAGLTLALVPLAVGGALTFSGSDERRDGGLYLMQAGLALAPIVSHLIAHEWKRAAIFGALPTASLIALVVLNNWPDVADRSAIGDQSSFGGRFAIVCTVLVSFLSSGVGLVDSLLAGERARRAGLSVVPTVGAHHVGLAIGGNL